MVRQKQNQEHRKNQKACMTCIFEPKWGPWHIVNAPFGDWRTGLCELGDDNIDLPFGYELKQGAIEHFKIRQTRKGNQLSVAFEFDCPCHKEKNGGKKNAK